MNRSLVALVILSFSGAAMPCIAPPPMLFRDHAALVNEAATILIVEAISAPNTPKDTCQFRVIQPLKGTIPEQFPILCRLPSSGDWMTHFSGHTESAFWKQNSGRLGIKSDCTVIPPAFEVNHYYLMLIGGKPDTKQFEELSNPQDKWLIFVNKQLSRGKR
ncbi:hypothetical protein NP603_21635 [Methylomonas sp. SURF-1]|uniref:Uncharacterized protein n=1 Tax=Methylomonas aurea TaxID=2952224 RepID=A0ABT1UNA5_9GAMM|nr:hypothetical protein [Methylomonas sp. SURF-1]MCQ8183720.1 hypothetical protein [Methylomonas sp. SURF-1]